MLFHLDIEYQEPPGPLYSIYSTGGPQGAQSFQI